MLKKVALLLCASIILISGCSSNVGGANSTQKESSSQESTTQETSKEENNTTQPSSEKANTIIKQLTPPKEGEEIAVISTSMGEIKIKFFPDEAPKAVENFKRLVREKKYYDDKIFHRVINGFVIQGGDPTGTGTGGESIWGENFEDEFSFDLHNLRGALSMANPGIPDSNGSQFFIVQANSVSEDLIEQMKQLNSAQDTKGMFPEGTIEAYKTIGGTPWLDYLHTVFGQVFEGIETVDAIAAVETAGEDKPVTDVKIEKVEIINYKK